MTRRALVLGAGGKPGLAWTSGFITGMREAGVEDINVDLVVGVSGGVIAGSYIAAGMSMEGLYRRFADGQDAALGWMTGSDPMDLISLFESVTDARIGDASEVRRRVGKIALTAPTMPEDRFRELFAADLPVSAWPERRFAIAAVSAVSGEPRLLDGSGRAGFVAAAAAGCALPGLCPAVTVDGDRYLDAGMRSGENLDLLRGFDEVLVVVLRHLDQPHPFLGPTVNQDVARLRGSGVQVHVIRPDGPVLDLIARHLFDPSVSATVAEAGREQARRDLPVFTRFLVNRPPLSS